MKRHLVGYAALAGLLAVTACSTPKSFSTPRLAELNAKVAARPSEAQVFVDRGYVYALLGQREAARADLQRACELSNTGPIHNQAGWACFNMGDAASALQHWETAARISKHNARYDYYSLALGYWATGDIARALENYDLAAKRDERFAEAASLAERITNWTDTEKREITAIFILWSKAYAPAKP